MNRGVHVAQCELIGRKLSVGSHVPLAKKENQLVFGKLRVDSAQRQHVKGEVPRGILEQYDNLESASPLVPKPAAVITEFKKPTTATASETLKFLCR